MPRSNMQQRGGRANSRARTRFTTPPFSCDNLPDFDINTFTSPSVSWRECHRRYKEFSLVLRDFTLYDAYWSDEPNRTQKPQEFQAYINTPPELFFEIGVGFTHNHAIIIVNEVKDELPEIFTRCYRSETKYTVQGGNLRLLHIRQDEFDDGYRLALEQRSSLYLERYFPQFRVSLTENKFRNIALQSFPPGKYELLVNDCATFAHNFCTNLLADLHQNRKINEQQYKRVKRELVKDIKIKEGPHGETEFVSRQNQQLGASGSSILQASEKS